MHPMKWIGLVLALCAMLAGCSSISERNRIDYKSAGKVAPLEVPPDLAAPGSDDRFTVPGSSTATYSNFSTGQRAKGEVPQLLPQPEGMRMQRAGAERWLVVQGEPEDLWERLREFWQDNGFLIAREVPEAGLMETDWAENRAKIPQSPIRKVIGLVLDDVYSYPERDKFRTRIERGEEPGTSEVFITHRGMYEVLTEEGRNRESTMWQARPTDPDLESEMLYRLMARLGASEQTVKQAAKEAPPAARAELKSSGQNVTGLQLEDSFDRAWRRVGLALDRIGFTVEDRDRSKGLYYVRYVDPDAEGKKKRSGLGRLAFWRDDTAPQEDAQFQISVKDGQQGSEVKVLNTTGEVEKSDTAGRILALLQEELK
jgi:outer membrane protein assembly factor BamC